MDLVRGGNALNYLSKTITFTGAAGLGAVGTTTVFTCTGQVLVVVLVPTCTVNLGEAGATATMLLGVTGDTDFFIASTNSTDVDAGDIWIDTTPAEVDALAVPAGFKDIWLDEDVIITHGSQATNSGAIRFDCYWMPLSPDGALA